MRYILFLFVILLCHSCKSDIPEKKLRKLQMDLKIERFEQELFRMNPDTLSLSIPYFYNKYDDFFDIFGYYIISIGSPAEKSYPGLMREFVTNPLNQQIMEKVNEVFPDMDRAESEFSRAFSRYKYYFPQDTIPRIISFISGFNYPNFTVGNYLGIGLDMYLGSECEFYRDLGIASYLTRNMNESRIIIDALYNFVNGKFPYNSVEDNVLSRMVHEGKIIWFLSKLIPGTSGESLFGFSEEQMKWTLNNEESMWVYLIENKLLYSTVQMDIRKLTGPAPYTVFFTGESPGRAVIYNGFKIVSEYSKRNPEQTVAEIMKMENYQDMLSRSRYNPK